MCKHEEIKRWPGSKVIRLEGISSEKGEHGNPSCVWSPVRHYQSCVANLVDTNRFALVYQINIGFPLKKSKKKTISQILSAQQHNIDSVSVEMGNLVVHYQQALIYIILEVMVQNLTQTNDIAL